MGTGEEQPQRELERAIALFKAGDRAEAADRLKKLVAAPRLDDVGRSVAWLWLAETSGDFDVRLDCLRQASLLQPENARISRELEKLQRASVGSLALQRAPAVVGLTGGRNGDGSGIFVDANGTAATTAYVVGGARRMRLKIRGIDALTCEVIRRCPEADLAILKAPVTIGDRVTQPKSDANEAVAFTALSFGRGRLRGLAEGDGGANQGAWLRTNVSPLAMPDAGGNPLYAGDGDIIGLLTQNVDEKNGMALAVPISRINALARQATADIETSPKAGYCGSCGSLARSGQLGGRYCETCGAALPAELVAVKTADDERLARLHNEDANAVCPHCASRVGAYAGSCLRCGNTLANSQTRN